MYSCRNAYDFELHLRSSKGNTALWGANFISSPEPKAHKVSL